MNDIKHIINTIEKKNLTLSSLVSAIIGLKADDDLVNSKRKLLNWCYAIEDELLDEKQFVVNMISSLKMMSNSIKCLNLKAINMEREKVMRKRTLNDLEVELNSTHREHELYEKNRRKLNHLEIEFKRTYGTFEGVRNVLYPSEATFKLLRNETFPTIPEIETYEPTSVILATQDSENVADLDSQSRGIRNRISPKKSLSTSKIAEQNYNYSRSKTTTIDSGVRPHLNSNLRHIYRERIDNLNAEKEYLNTEIDDLKDKLITKKEVADENAKVRQKLKEKLLEKEDEILELKKRYDDLLIEKKEYEEATALKPGEVVIRKEKISKVIEILLKTFFNENLSKYVEFETKADLSYKALLEIDENKLDHILKFIFDLGKKEDKVIGQVNKDKKKVFLSDNVKKFNVEYKKPKVNKKLEFPSKLVTLNQSETSTHMSLSPNKIVLNSNLDTKSSKSPSKYYVNSTPQLD